MKYFLNQLERNGTFTANERAAWAAFAETTRFVPRRRTIRREGEPAEEFYILHGGWVASSVMSPEGNRFITKIHLPGEVIGSPSMCCDQATETMLALTEVEISSISLAAFGALIAEHPRLAGLFLLAVQYERVTLTNRLLTVGRSNAEGAVSALLLDLFARLTDTGIASGDTFELELTQEEIGDATGLTPVHVNRTLRRLKELGLLDRKGRKVTILDRTGLDALAGRRPLTRRSRLDWLPPSRG